MMEALRCETCGEEYITRRSLSAHIRQTRHVAWNGLPLSPVVAGDSTSNTGTGFVPVAEHPVVDPLVNHSSVTQMAHGAAASEAGDLPLPLNDDAVVDWSFLDRQSNDWPNDDDDETPLEIRREGDSPSDESLDTQPDPEVLPDGRLFPNNPQIWHAGAGSWVVNPMYSGRREKEKVHSESSSIDYSDTLPEGDQSNVDDPDRSLIDKYIEYCDSGLGNMVSTAHYKTDVKLLKLLKTAGCPIYLFNQIKEWAHESAVGGVGVEGVQWKERSAKRAAVLADIRKRFNMEETAPSQLEVTLPGSGERVTITLHDFKQQVYSLLSDPVAMRDENLLFHNDDPFAPPTSCDTLKDVNDGSVYHDAYKVHCKVGDRDVLACPIFFIDKTHVDEGGRLCLEPVTFTLSIFKKEARSKPLFWRTIGYVANQSHIKKVTPIKKAVDYHYVLELILRSVVAVQKGNGLAWDLKYKNRTYKVVFKTPALFVIGDTEGHDKMVGKFNCRTGNVKCLCRICDIQLDDTDNPMMPFCFTTAADIAAKVEASDSEGLRLMSYHCILNAFRNLIFCDPERGINGAVPGELLHVWQLGLFLRFLASLFGQKRARQTASRKRSPSVKVLEKKQQTNEAANNKRKQAAEKGNRKEGTLDAEGVEEDYDEDDDEEEEEEDDDEEDEEEVVEEVPVLHTEDEDVDNPSAGPGYVVMEADDLTKNGVFTDAVKMEFDEIAKEYGKCLRHQSDREFNRAYFPTGITTNCKKNGSEERCVLMLCLIIFLSHKGPDFDELLDGKTKLKKNEEEQGNKRSSANIEIISQLLLMEHFLKTRSISAAVLSLYERYVPYFLGYYKTVVARATGLGLKLIKFHLPVHSANDMSRFGPAMSWDSSTGESNHKEIKEPARHTQRNTRAFEQQTAVRHHEDLAIDRAHRHLHPPMSQIGASTEVAGTAKSNVFRGAKYYVDEKKVMFNSQAKWSRKKPTVAVWTDSQLQNRVLDLIVNHILPCVPSGKVTLWTELKADGTLYRANPSYGKLQQPWHDWADFSWDLMDGTPGCESESIPGRLVVYIDIDGWKEGSSIEHDGLIEISGVGKYVFVESLIENLYEHPTNAEKYVPEACPEGLPNYLAHPVCSLVYWSHFEMEALDESVVDKVLVPKLRVLNVDSMEAPRIVVPFNVFDTHPVQWLIIEPGEKWGQLMVDEMQTAKDAGLLHSLAKTKKITKQGKNGGHGRKRKK